MASSKADAACKDSWLNIFEDTVLLNTPKVYGVLRKAALASFLLAAASSSMADIITYNYSGTIFGAPGATSIVGSAVQAEFVIDTGIAPVTPDFLPTSRIYPFSVLSATYSFLGLTFNSKPYADFNPLASYLGGANQNNVQIAPDPTQNRLFVRTFSTDLQGAFTSSGMELQVIDKPAFGAVNSLQIPTSFSGLDLTPGNDIILLSMGYCVTGGVCSSLGSRNGSLTASSVAPVPEPEVYAMLLAGLGLLGFAKRRKKQKTV